jgi:hypothetical protein
VNCAGEQTTHVPAGANISAPARRELIEQDADRRTGCVGEGANERWCRLVVADVFRHATRTFARLLHGHMLAGVFGESLLYLECRLEAVTPRIERSPIGSKQQRRFHVRTRCVPVRKLFQSARQRAVLEPQPRPAWPHVELIVERIGLPKPESLLLAVKDLVHQ